MASADPTGLRVLVVTNMYPTSSDPVYGTFVRTQMDSIGRLGLDVNVDFIDGRRGAWRYVTAIARVWRLAKDRYDLIHAHYGLTGFIAGAPNLPLVVSFCVDDLLGTPNGTGGLTTKSWVTIRLSRVAARRADGIICKSAEMRESLPSVRDRERAHVIPNGVDTHLFRPGNRLEARRELGLQPGERLIIFPSTPTERRKRLDLALAAVEAANAMGVECRLWPVTNVLPAHMPTYYRAADALLLTSDWEGSPNVVKEVLCCDIPVVSVLAGDVERWLTVVPGCRIVPRTPQGIAAGLRDVLNGPRRVDGAPVRRALGLPAIARQVVGVYHEAIARRRGKRGLG